MWDTDEDKDFALALQLQNEFENENNLNSEIDRKPNSYTSVKPQSIIDTTWELIDPTPDVRAMFLQFNEMFFWGRLAGIEVRWSPRMTSCAGICCYEGRGGLCSVRLSVPLLKLRPRKDLVETLLHEMIHAYLFVTDNNKDHDGHGPEFCKHMYRINKETGTKITVYHSFHDEVNLYKQHWWRCDGPCKDRPPYHGWVKRSMNRAPGPNDLWWAEHQTNCGGSYTKVKEPEGYKNKASKASKENKSGGFKQPSLPYTGGNRLGGLASGDNGNRKGNAWTKSPTSSIQKPATQTSQSSSNIFTLNGPSTANHTTTPRSNQSGSNVFTINGPISKRPGQPITSSKPTTSSRTGFGSSGKTTGFKTGSSTGIRTGSHTSTLVLRNPKNSDLSGQQFSGFHAIGKTSTPGPSARSNESQSSIKKKFSTQTTLDQFSSPVNSSPRHNNPSRLLNSPPTPYSDPFIDVDGSDQSHSSNTSWSSANQSRSSSGNTWSTADQSGESYDNTSLAAGQSLHECPVCFKMFKEYKINAHVDLCLTLHTDSD